MQLIPKALRSAGREGAHHRRCCRRREQVCFSEAAAQFAFDVLEEGGTFVAKVLAGGAEIALQTTLKRNFRKVANVKPPASRPDSSEKCVVATGFRGPGADSPPDDAEAE